MLQIKPKFFLVFVICIFAAGVLCKECGVNKFNNKRDSWERIIGGQEAVKYSWPWMISLKVRNILGQMRHTCGASIINSQWIVTAGHCVYKRLTPSLYQVWVAEHSQKNKEGQEYSVNVEKVIIHENYSPDTIRNDIALMKLSRPLDLSSDENVNAVCLPEDIDPNFVGENCVTTGWGCTDKFQGPGSDVLNEIALPIIPEEECKKKYDKLLPIAPSMICAGGREVNKSGCHGDSGGPLVCERNNKWYLVGIVSWGDDVDKSKKVISVFTRVTSFTSWIQQKISQG